MITEISLAHYSLRLFLGNGLSEESIKTLAPLIEKLPNVETLDLSGTSSFCVESNET